jgi:hypothetical protein
MNNDEAGYEICLVGLQGRQKMPAFWNQLTGRELNRMAPE